MEVDTENLPFPRLYERQSRLIKYLHVVSERPLQLRIQLQIFDVPSSNSSPCLEYTALSYTWEGDDIQIDVYDESGTLHRLKITNSLATGLIHLHARFANGEFPSLWADQICIDQNNVEDKVRQIPLMEHIFQYAKQVHVWLGILDQRTEIAMRAIEILGQELRHLTGQQPGQLLVTSHKERARDLLYNVGLGQLPTSTVWSLIAEFCRKRWFSRAWILQEATVPDQPIDVHCGKYCIPFDAIVRVWHAVNNLYPVEHNQIDPSLKAINDSGLRTLNILSFIRNPNNAPKTTLLDLRRISLGSQATNPRDKIYSIMGMASDWRTSTTALGVDYNGPLKHVYTMFAIWHIFEHGNLDFLGEARPASCTKRDLPCWVPEWSETEETKDWISLARRSVDPTDHGIPVYNASPPIDTNLLRYNFGNKAPEALTLKGVFLGTITTIPIGSQRMKSLDARGFWQRTSTLCQGLDYEHIAERAFAADTYQDNDTNSTFYRYKRGAYYRFSSKSESVRFLFRTSKHKMSRKTLFVCDATPLGFNMEAILGSGPDTMQDGDELWTLHGGQVLYILRPWQWRGSTISHFNASGDFCLNGPQIQPSKTFDFVGDAFALGLMDGELSAGRFAHLPRETVCLLNPSADSTLTDLPPQPRDVSSYHAQQVRSGTGQNHMNFDLKSLQAQQMAGPLGYSVSNVQTAYRRMPHPQSPGFGVAAQSQQASPFGSTGPPAGIGPPAGSQQASPFGSSVTPRKSDRYVAFSNIGTVFGR